MFLNLKSIGLSGFLRTAAALATAEWAGKRPDVEQRPDGLGSHSLGFRVRVPIGSLVVPFWDCLIGF